MSVSERENIHTLFLGKNYLELYKTQSKVLQAMLFVETQKEFEDFLKNEERLEEDIFWLYYETVQGESLLIGGYEEDVTSKVTTFMKKKLPETAFTAIQNIYKIFMWTLTIWIICKKRWIFSISIYQNTAIMFR